MSNYISRNAAEELCDSMIREYFGPECPEPKPVEIESFIAEYLKCPIRYEDIAEAEKDKVGFISDGSYPIRIKRNGRIISATFPKNTIVIDKYLLRPEEERHRRFVLSHEAGHVIASLQCPESTGCFNRFHDSQRTEYTLQELRERYSIGEYNANMIGAALLMPQSKMWAALKWFNGGRRLPVYGEWVFHPREKVILKKMADALKVSHTALVIRLRELGMLNRHDISEYLHKELGLRGTANELL